MIDLESIPSTWATATFEDLLDYIQPTNFIVESTDYNDNFKTPVLTAGKSFIIGYTNEKNGIFNSLPTIIFDDFTTATQFVNFPFKVKSSAMKILQPTCDLVNIRYAYYFMQTVHIKSETHKRYWISEYSKLPIPLPPKNETERIVSKIEELFTELDKGIEQLQTVQRQLKTYRQAVLKWAFDGKLTNENVKDGELPKGWKRDTIKDVCLNVKVGIVIKPTEFYDNTGKGIHAFRSANVREFKVNDSDWVYFTKEGHEANPRTQLKEGEVLIVRSGYPGTSCVVPKKFDGANAIDILIASPDEKKILPEYLCAYNNSPLAKGLFKEKSRGVAQKHLNVGEYSKLYINYPEVNEQKKIIKEIESRLSVCDKIGETIENALQQAEALRLSILKKAFEGKLVQQNPKDEPAAKLLERIKAMKQKGAEVKPKSKKKKELA